MIIKAINLISFIGFVISSQSNLQWNIDQPYTYNGFIYVDSQVVVLNPAIQIKLMNNEEVCNFFVNGSGPTEEPSIPFRAVVRSAHLGLGELELRPNVSLEDWRGREVAFSVVAEACHDPDSWSVPASVLIKILDPPGPVWTQSRYSATVNNSAPVGSTIIQVTAYPPRWSDPQNKICQYSIKSPNKSPFQIDGEGTIRVMETLIGVQQRHWTLIVEAADCSVPVQRRSSINVFLSRRSLCKMGWTGFYKRLKYNPGSGVKYLCSHPKFRICMSQDDNGNQIETAIKHCIANKTLRLTTSVELKSKSPQATDEVLSDHSNCKLDYKSLHLQREVCGISASYSVDLLSELTKQQVGISIFPIQANIFPATYLSVHTKFSFYFWIQKSEMSSSDGEEYIACQIDEVGSNIFSVSMRRCLLKVQLRSYASKSTTNRISDQSVPTSWSFSVPQLCDNKWHHVAILASRASSNSHFAELNVFLDGEMMDYRSDHPEIQYEEPMQQISSNVTDLFLGQCPKSENTEFKGLLAGVTLTPGVLIKGSSPRCLTKCAERLYFNGMNQMNPGMSVSLNSQMQVVIINGHSIDEVTRLVKVIGFVNPTWDPLPGDRHLRVETELRCGQTLISVPPMRIVVYVVRQMLPQVQVNIAIMIKLFSTVTSVLVPDPVQTNSDLGTGVAIFANTSLEISGIPRSTDDNAGDAVAPSIITKCAVSMHPRLTQMEYVDWPRNMIADVSGDKYSIQVSNDSRSLVIRGQHNPQIYQFVIQNLRFYSPTTLQARNQGARLFQLQCFSHIGAADVKSNIIVVKVTIWYDSPHDNDDSTAATINDRLWKDAIANNSAIKHSPSLNAQSNAALISEMEVAPRRQSNIMVNVLLGMGLLMLVTVITMVVRKISRSHSHDGCLSSRKVTNGLCLPLLMIKDKVSPGPSIRVELSRDCAHCDLWDKRTNQHRNIGLEMQWDDAELKESRVYNIITNPMYETSICDIDDITLNEDVPPSCDDGDSNGGHMSDEDDNYEDFTDLYFDRNRVKADYRTMR